MCRHLCAERQETPDAHEKVGRGALATASAGVVSRVLEISVKVSQELKSRITI